ncbi:MAG: 4Fe-4S dicluster domain-containing protein [Deltaproteobacteria bacterium]|jgi:Fe-S-cluster-containing dehydrogenase component|nr:4Fe-4S dicluster domain-containing protein [Deltaproteobacteria bacterium]
MKEKGKRYAMFIDTSICFDCKSCMIACKVENNVSEGFWRNWVKHNAVDCECRTQFQPGQCMQCDDPSCVSACPVGATYKGKNGLVEIDADTCIGCGNCVTSCPYNARYRNPTLKIADKCDFCAHLVERGEDPACVQTCPTKVRVFGDLNDPASQISQILKNNDNVQVVNPLINTRPNIYYSKNTQLLLWPEEPTLPGGVHMSPDFWKAVKEGTR